MKMFTRIVLSFILLFSACIVFAGEVPYTQKSLDELRANGKPVVVHFHATWCPTCKKQAEIVNSLLAEKQFKDLTVLRADVDTEKALMKNMNVAERSTFVVFKGRSEVARSTGDTNQNSIATLFQKAL